MDPAYSIRELSIDEFRPLFDRHKFSAFAGDHSYSLVEALSESEFESRKSLGKNMGDPYRLYLGAFDQNENFVGWTWGLQESQSTFYMCNSAVLEKHKRKGIYSALVEKCKELVIKKGFQLIYSRHNATNNAVLIPKLKADFIISKMELDDVYGVLIHLHYYANRTRRKVMDYRSGQASPDDEIKELFKL